MELRHLRYFATVAAERSFSRAAEKLHIAQPPLSRQIQQLEDELGTQLFNRGRPITLTEAGRYLFEQAVQMLRKSEELRTMTKRIGTGKKRQFGIGFVASTLYDTLPELIRDIRLAEPNVEIVLTELITIEQAIALKEGRIDIGFGRLWFDDDDLTRRVLREEKLVIAAPRGDHLNGMRGRLTLKQIVDVPLILYPNAPRPSYADQVLSFYRKRGLQPNVGFEVRELQTALGLVAAGLGISIVPLSVRRLGREDVNYLPLEEPDIASPIIVSYRSNDESDLLARMLTVIEELHKTSNARARQGKPRQTADRRRRSTKRIK